MKKVSLVFSLFSLLALTVPAANAQGNLVQFSIGMPTTLLQVINTTDDRVPVLVNISGNNMWAPPKQKVWKQFGYGTWANAAVEVDVCSTAPLRHFVNPPPPWATNPSIVGSAALPADYSDPSVSALKARVGLLKHAIRDRVGGKGMKAEIDAWFRKVKQRGFEFTAPTCEDPVILVNTKNVSQWGYGRTITLLVSGNRDDGYKLSQSR